MQSVAAEQVFTHYVREGEEATEAPQVDKAVELQAALDEYRELGHTPAEIATKLQEYYSLVAAAKQEQAQGGEKKPAPKASKLDANKREEIQRELLEMFPGLGQLDDLVKNVQTFVKKTEGLEAKTAAEVAKNASKQVVSLVESRGYDKTGAKFIENAIANEIYSRPSLMKRLHEGDDSVVEEIFDRFDKEFFSKSLNKKPVKPTQADLHRLLSGNQGKTTEKKGSSSDASHAQDGRSSQDRMRETSNKAFDLYNQIASANDALRMHGE